MVYTVEQIAQRILPVAQKYGLKAVYLFGSYARGTATESSDIDLLIDTSGTNIKSLLSLSAVYCDLEDALQKSIDLITVSSLEQRPQMENDVRFRDTVLKERCPKIGARRLYASSANSSYKSFRIEPSACRFAAG